MIYFVLCYFIIIFLITRFQKSKIGNYLIGVYTFSMICSVILYNSESDLKYQYLNFVPSIVYCLFLTVYFLPFLKKEIVIIPSYNEVFLRRFALAGKILSLILLIGCFFLITKVKEAIAFGLVDTRVAMYKEESIYTNYNIIEHIGHSTLKWLSGVCYALLIMFFYAYTFIKKELFLKYLLLVSSLSAVYLGLLVGGRTNLMYWILSFIFCLILFWPYFTAKKKRLISLLSLITLGLLLSYLIYVSIERALVGHEGETGNFLLTYAGQSYLNFCYFFENLNSHEYTTQRVLPITSSIFLEKFNLNEYRDIVFYKSGMNIGIFYTFLGDIYVDLGIFGMIVYSILYYIIAIKVMRKKVFTLSDILILGILFQIPLHGVFYYSFWKTETSASVILILIIAKYLQSNKIIKWKI